MGREYVDGSGTPIDVSQDQFQGCNHYGFTGTTSPVNGLPHTTKPRKTWLDECAMMAMQGIITKRKHEVVSVNEWEVEARVAIGAYDYAEAMLAEKMKREARE